MKIVAITQARFASTRLPGKVLLKIGNDTVLDVHLRRIKRAKLIDQVVVATTLEPEADEIVHIAQANSCAYSRGSLDDVLDRFYQACKEGHPDLVVRLTSDCPIIDPDYIDDLVRQFQKQKVDYASNSLRPTLPDGMDAEIFTFAALEEAWKLAKKKSEREHVTPYIRESGRFQVLSVEYQPDLSNYRLTLDTSEDLALLQALVAACGPDANLKTYIDYLKAHPEIFALNQKYERNEGYKKSLQEDQ
jgi:spore coat polysaccharide biosynthesis protein SpsF